MAVTLPPQYRFTTSSTLSEDTGVAVDKTDDGATALRGLYPYSYFDIDVDFAALPIAEHLLLMAFLRTNKLAEIAFSIDGEAYLCRIVKPPAVKFVSIYRQVSVQFRGRLA